MKWWAETLFFSGAAENGGYFNNVREGGKVNARLCSIFIGEKKTQMSQCFENAN